MPVEEVWGIDGASVAKLAKLGIMTAADLAALKPDDARALMTVLGLITFSATDPYGSGSVRADRPQRILRCR